MQLIVQLMEVWIGAHVLFTTHRFVLVEVRCPICYRIDSFTKYSDIVGRARGISDSNRSVHIDIFGK